MANSNTDVILSLGSAYKKLMGSDVLKAVITMFFTAFFASLIEILPPLLSKDIAPTWHEVTMVLKLSIAAGLGALGRKYFTNSVGQVFKKEPENAMPVSLGTKEVKE
jgi:hypothetical protein